MKRKFKQTLSGILSTAMVLSLVAVAPTPLSQVYADNVAMVWTETDLVVNGDFESSAEAFTGWTEVDDGNVISVAANEWATNTTNQLNFSSDNSGEVSLSQDIVLDAGTYKFSWEQQGAIAASGITCSVTSGGVELVSKVAPETEDWNVYADVETDEFTLTEGATVTVSFAGNVSGYWGTIDNIVLQSYVEKRIYNVTDLTTLLGTIPSDYAELGFTENSLAALNTAKTAAEELVEAESTDSDAIEEAYVALEAAIAGLTLSADIFVKKIEGYDTDSIRGVDVSSYISIMNTFDAIKADMKAEGMSDEEIAAAKIGFKDWDGNVLSRQGFFGLLAASGVNYVRTRVWNDPYNSESGNGYGGGNNDVATAKEIAEYATEAGMKNLIDFHFSDFWADPGKQQTPKAWADYTVEQKATAIADFVEASLTEIESDGAKVSMVQIGNETNGKFCGESTWDNMNVLFDAGCDAVHEHDEEILAAIHFTNPEGEGRLAGYAESLASYDANSDSVAEGVSYDVFATSYYPYWHGTMKNLTSVLKTVATTYDKYVMVAETSWANTYTDGDGHENTIKNATQLGDYVSYNVTVQGQVNAIRDVAAAVNDVGVTLKNGDKAALGFFYWEPAWIPVQSVVDSFGNEKENADEIIEENQEYWEEYGSGWAAAYASEYDPDDAGMWHGGSAVDNQSIFDFEGNPIPSMNVFKYLSYGSAAAAVIPDGYTIASVEMEIGDAVEDVLPTSATVVYNDGTEDTLTVNWSSEDVAEVNAATATNTGIGEYKVTGTLEGFDNYKVETTVTALPPNLLADGSFEGGDKTGNWTIAEGAAGSIKTGEDKRTGIWCFHFYNSSDFTLGLSTEMVVTEPGYYNAWIYMQGLSSAGSREGESLVLKATTVDGKEYISENVTLGGWNNWQKPMVYNIYVSQEMIDAGQNTIILSVEGTLLAESWGTMDDAHLYIKDANPVNLTDCDVTIDTTNVTYTGEAVEPVVTVKNGENILVLNKDYVVAYSDNVNVGTATVTVTSCGEGCIGSKTVEFDIKEAELENAEVTIAETTYEYDGTAKTPEVTVTDGEQTLVEDTDYTVEYANNAEVGTATVTVTGKGNYAGTVEKTFEIVEPKQETPETPETPEITEITETDVILAETTYEYDGTAKTPEVTVKVGTKTLVKDTDYIVAYKNNTEIGTATVTVTGKGNYAGTVEKTFEIVEPKQETPETPETPEITEITEADVILAETTYEYDGTAKTPEVTVKVGTKTLVKDTDYIVAYKNNTEVGTATVTITGKGRYKGTVEKNFTINKKAVVVGNIVEDADATYTVETVASADGKTVGTVAYQAPTSKSAKKVSIPATVTVDGVEYEVAIIAENAFKDSKVQEVTVGKNVTTIGKNAFKGCTKLKKVKGCSKVTKIESGAFSGCTNLTSATIGSKVKTIGSKAFNNCKKLKSITIPASVTKIGEKAFYNNKKLAKITIKTTKLTKSKVGKNAFKGIYEKAKINVPNKKLASYKSILKSRGVGNKATIK